MTRIFMPQTQFSFIIRLSLLTLTGILPGLRAHPIETLVPEAITTPDGWRQSGWLGRLYPVEGGWMFHETIGWWYLPAGQQPESFWCYDVNFGWVWSARDVFPFVWLGQSGEFGYWYPHRETGPSAYLYLFETREWLPLRPYPPFWFTARQAFRMAGRKALRTLEAVTDPQRFPSAATNTGPWTTVPASNWVSGFFPAQLWYLYLHTGDPAWKTRAEERMAPLAALAASEPELDLSFMVGLPYMLAYEQTGDPAYREILLTATHTLRTLYSENVGCLRSWAWGKYGKKPSFAVIIDNMISLEPLLWAAREDDPASPWKDRWLPMAVSHALKTRENHLRSDGSQYHVVVYDERNGRLLYRETYQGFANESAWARGQAWGIIGFTTLHAETGDPRFRASAEAMADYFLRGLPDDSIPYWDFQHPEIPDTHRDSSAGAIAAEGLLRLAPLASSPEKASRYDQAALAILASLASPVYFAPDLPESQALLMQAAGFVANGAANGALIYADFYFVKALHLYLSAVRREAWGVEPQRFLPPL